MTKRSRMAPPLHHAATRGWRRMPTTTTRATKRGRVAKSKARSRPSCRLAA